MLFPCNAKHKYVVIELCDHILVQSIDFANYELFSSTFTDITVSIADRYKPKEHQTVLPMFVFWSRFFFFSLLIMIDLSSLPCYDYARIMRVYVRAKP